MTDILQSLAMQADTPAGTFVGADVTNFGPEHRALLKPLTGLKGSKVPAAKLHTTVIFSKGSYVEPKLIEPAMAMYKMPIKAKIIAAAAFDALPSADGSRDEEVSTLVLKLECPEMMELHATCKQLGCTHTFPELSPHLSLYYGVPKTECHQAVDELNKVIAKLEEPLFVELSKFYTEPIKQDWAVKNTSKR